MEIKRYVGFIEVNTYVCIDEDKNCIIIDPSDNALKIVNELKRDGFFPKAVLLTHGHFDHIEGVFLLRDLLPVYVFEGEKSFINDKSLNLSYQLGKSQPDVFENYETFSVGKLKIEGFNKEITVIHTAGHTSGSCCFLIDNALFSGDTLFCEGFGRYDFPTGNFERLKNSIVYLIDNLPPKTEVYTGHGEKTTIEREKLFNGLYLYANKH